jgi:hypothetical protein
MPDLDLDKNIGSPFQYWKEARLLTEGLWGDFGWGVSVKTPC